MDSQIKYRTFNKMSAFEASSVIAAGSELGVDFTNTLDFDGVHITTEIVFPFPATTSVASYTRGGVDIHYMGTNDSFQITPNINSIMSEAGTGGGDTLRLAYTATSGLPANFIVSQNTGIDEATVNLQLYSESTTETWQTNLDAKGLTMMPSDINKYANGLTCVDGLTIQNSIGTVSLNAQNGLSVNKIFANDVSPLEMRSATTFFEQVEFNTYAPHTSVVPEFSNDLTNKAYVDSRIASGGNNFLYFNYSVNTDTYIAPNKQLGSSIINGALQTVDVLQNGTNLIASFMTNTGLPYITSIPAGLWELNQFGNVLDRKPNSTLFYQFTVSLYTPSTGATVVIGTSAYSTDVNALAPTLYIATATIDTTACALEDRIIVKVYGVGDLNNAGDYLSSYFQNNLFSYITCPLLTGQNLLNLNNTWVGANSFTQSAVIPTGSFPQTTAAVNGAYLTANYVDNTLSQSIDGFKTFVQSVIIPTGAFPRTTEAVNGSYVGANFVDLTNPQTAVGKKTFTTGIASNSIDAVANNSTCEICPVLTNGVLNIAKNCTGTVSLGNTGILNIGTGVRSAGKNISIGTGVGSVGATNIGALTSVLTLYGGIGSVANLSSAALTFGSATCVSIQGKSGALAFGNDDTITNGVYIGALTKPTTIYGSVASNIDLTGGSINCGYLNGSSGALSIGGLIATTSTQIGRAGASTQLVGTCTAPTVADAGDASDNISTTQWVNNFFGSVAGMFGQLTLANTWIGQQTFSNPLTLGIIAPTFPSQLGSSSFNNTATTVSPINVGNSRIASTAGVVLTQGVYLCSVNSGYSFAAGTVFTSGDYTIQNGMSQQANNLANIALVPLSQTSGNTHILCAASTTIIGSNCCVLSSTVVLIVPLGGGTYFGSTYLFNNATTSTIMPKAWAQLISIVRIG